MVRSLKKKDQGKHSCSLLEKDKEKVRIGDVTEFSRDPLILKAVSARNLKKRVGGKMSIKGAMREK